jgi:hypothetical protein
MGQQRQYAAIDPQMEAAFRQISAELNYRLPATTSLSMYVQTMAQYIANQVNYDLANDFYAVWKNNPVLSSILGNRTGDLPLSQKAYLTDVARQEWIKNKEAELGRQLTAAEKQEAIAISETLQMVFSVWLRLPHITQVVLQLKMHSLMQASKQVNLIMRMVDRGYLKRYDARLKRTRRK